MIDICFVGNSSIDIIKNKTIRKTVYGGSAIYSSLSCRNSSNKKIAILSTVNKNLKNLLDNKKIELIGNISEEITIFEIDEEFGSCKFVKKIENNIKGSNIDTDYLHVSFRKGVDIDAILENSGIKYNHLTIDVMIHSLKEFIPIIQKYEKKIEILFCNSTEYNILINYITNIPIIVVTNQEKPVVVIEKDKNTFFDVPQDIYPISTTGAGDTFIGGFLAKYIEKNSIEKSIKEGIKNSSYSITQYGPILEKPDFKFEGNNGELPKNIIVIGSSCAGKTTFIDFIKNQYNIFTDIDDLPPLLEMFLIDDLSVKSNIDELKTIKSKLIYMKDIYNQYLMDYPKINHYSMIAKDGNGHDILKPELWDMILQRAVLYLKKENNIVQFSRGKDKKYEKKYDGNVYYRSLNIVMNELNNKERSIIVNVFSDLEVRKKRNKIRYENGGHFVSEETMNTVYNIDEFKYTATGDNKGFIKLDNKDYPVYCINNNKMLSKIELNQFLSYNLSEMLKYYKHFKEGKNYEDERSSKRNMAK